MVTLRQTGTGKPYELRFRRTVEGWRILVPPCAELDASLTEFLAGRGGVSPTPARPCGPSLKGLPRWAEGELLGYADRLTVLGRHAGFTARPVRGHGAPASARQRGGPVTEFEAAGRVPFFFSLRVPELA